MNVSSCYRKRRFSWSEPCTPLFACNRLSPGAGKLEAAVTVDVGVVGSALRNTAYFVTWAASGHSGPDSCLWLSVAGPGFGVGVSVQRMTDACL